MEQYDHRIDEYLGKKTPYAQEILKYIRELVHSVSPLITETIKWGHPFFEYKGTLANMAAFKEHCSFGFWKGSLINDPDGIMDSGGDPSAGNFGRITCLADLPTDEQIIGFIKQAMALNDAGTKGTMKKPAATAKAPIEIPEYFTAALAANQKALAVFQDFSPSQKREYLEWLVDAKTEATRQKRLDTALEWIADGKTRHWKYK